MRFQTCRRHPSAGRFMATCSGCDRELYDIRARNEAMALARKALGHTAAEVLDAEMLPRDMLLVAVREEGELSVRVIRAVGGWQTVASWTARDEAGQREQWAAARDEYAPRIVLPV